MTQEQARAQKGVLVRLSLARPSSKLGSKEEVLARLKIHRPSSKLGSRKGFSEAQPS
jgi:hypothetical protein